MSEENENVVYLLKLGKYFETTRLFSSYDKAMIFVVKLFRNETQIHHKHSGYSSVSDFNLYKVEVGVNKCPKAIKRKVLNAELEKRGLVRGAWGDWK